METQEEHYGAPRGLLLTLGIIGLVLGGGIAGEFVLRLQPGLSAGTAAAGSVIMPQGVGANTALTYSPETITLIIGVNNTVIFKDQDSSAQYHTVTATDKSFDSGNLKSGQSWTYTFSTPGTYTYYCIYHSWMKGKVIVKASGGQISNGSGFTVTIPAGAGSDTSLGFTPKSVTLVAGVNNTVTFVNQDSTKHSVTATDGSFDSGDILPGASWTHTFAAGTYSYHCVYHTYMTGTIKVLSS
jgi:plastocyanin